MVAASESQPVRAARRSASDLSVRADMTPTTITLLWSYVCPRATWMTSHTKNAMLSSATNNVIHRRARVAFEIDDELDGSPMVVPASRPRPSQSMVV